MWAGGQHNAPDALPPGITRYPLYRRLGGSQGRSGEMWKISSPPGFDPRTVQPVAIHYTDLAISAHILPIRNKNKTTSYKSLQWCKKCCSETKHKNAVSNINLVQAIQAPGEGY
jgi:hypothetical protein